MSTVSGGREVMPPPPLVVPAGAGSHAGARCRNCRATCCTGPVAIKGAKAGQVLEVRIKDIKLPYDWGYNFSGPSRARCRTISPSVISCISRSTGKG